MTGEKKPNCSQDEQERADPLAEEGSKLLAGLGSSQQITPEYDTEWPQQETASAPSSLTVPSTIRPQSVLKRDKSLPPLPHEINLHPPTDQLDSQPRTVYPYDHRQIPAGASPPVQDFSAPRAPFRNDEARTRSFDNISSRPNFTAQTLPSRGLYTPDLKPPAAHYNEFGASRRSLGFLENVQEKHQIPGSPTPSKRKSKFGLATILGRKSQTYGRDLIVSPSPTRRSTSDARDDDMSNGGYATSASRYSMTPRMSIVSRKVEELVEQVSTLLIRSF
jgi:hypothetical protein